MRMKVIVPDAEPAACPTRSTRATMAKAARIRDSHPELPFIGLLICMGINNRAAEDYWNKDCFLSNP